jgi:carbonic anhydrase
MSHLDPLLERNRAFAASDARQPMALNTVPHHPVFVITCIDPRVDPAAFLGLELGDAVVLRNAGGRVTPAVIEDVAFISYMAEMTKPDGPLFEVAVIHHNQCGTGFLASDEFRHGFAQRTGFDETALAEVPVLDLAATVRADVDRLLAAPQISPRISVSGRVYDVETGIVSTVIAPTAPRSARERVAA